MSFSSREKDQQTPGGNRRSPFIMERLKAYEEVVDSSNSQRASVQSTPIERPKALLHRPDSNTDEATNPEFISDAKQFSRIKTRSTTTNLRKSTSATSLLFDDSLSLSPPDKTSTKYKRPPVEQSITENFKNALVTDPVFKNLSRNASRTIYTLLEEIEENFQNSITVEEPSRHSSSSTSHHLSKPSTKPPMTNQTTQVSLQHQTTDQTTQVSSDCNCDINFIYHKLDSTFHKLDAMQTKLDEVANATTSQQTPFKQQPKSTLVITPNNPEDLPQLAADLQALPIPDDIQIQKLKLLQDKVEVRATSESSKQLLKDLIISSEIAPTENIQDKTPRQTKIILFNIYKNANILGLERAISSKLSLPQPIPVELFKRIPSKYEDYEHWVVSVPSRIAAQLLRSHHIFSGLRKIYLKKYIFITRCTKCQRLDHHSASKCTAKRDFCSTCGGSHHFKNCDTSTPRCINCVEYNSDLKREAKTDSDPILKNLISTRHNAASSMCPCYRYLFDQKKTSPHPSYP